MRFNILPFFSSKYFPFASVSLVIVLTFLVKLLIGVFVYKDCKKRNMEPILWTLIVVLVPSYIGLIVYLVVRFSNYSSSENHRKRCKHCGAVVQNDWTVCPYCKNEITRENIINETKNNMNGSSSSNTSTTNYNNNSKYTSTYNKTSNYNNDGFYEEKDNSNILKIVIIVIIIITLIGGIVVANLFSVHRFTDIFPNSNIELSSTSSESTHSIKKSYSYWNGNEEKAVKIKESGNLTLVYNLVCEEGSLYAVLKDDDNKLIYTFSQNGKGVFEKYVNKGETYYLSINGIETKGKFSFNWDID